MVKIDNYFNDMPAIMKESVYFNKIKTLLEKIERGEAIKSEDIKDYAPPEVKIQLEKIFKEKCAFCECDTKSGARYDTEHFRPKSIYYWLAYVWSNFLLSCQRCNRENKKVKFPVNSSRAIALIIDFKNKNSVIKFYQDADIESALLKAENRLLLHPVLDNPLDHLLFNADGTVTGITQEGKESISVYGLSDDKKRIKLISDRKKVIKSIKKEVHKAVLRYQKSKNKEILYDDLLDIHIDIESDIDKAEEPFLAVRHACLVNFKSFFIDEYIGSPYEKLLNDLFKQIDLDIKSVE